MSRQNIIIDRDYNYILDNLILGNINSARNIDIIKNNNIRYIFNISNGIPNYFYIDKNIKYYNLYVADSLLDFDINIMAEHLPDLVLDLDNCLMQNNGNVLVHCHAGQQRSAILVAAYLIYKYSISPEEAYKFILKKRPIAFYYGKSFNFHKALMKYYHHLKK